MFALLDGHLAPPATRDDRPDDRDHADRDGVDRPCDDDETQATWSAPQLRVLATLAALVVVMHDDHDDDGDAATAAEPAAAPGESRSDVTAAGWAQAEAAVEAQRL